MAADKILELFGRNVAKYRKAKGMTIEDLSKKTKIRSEYLSRIEKYTAKRIILPKTMVIAEALGIPLWNLFE